MGHPSGSDVADIVAAIGRCQTSDAPFFIRSLRSLYPLINRCNSTDYANESTIFTRTGYIIACTKLNRIELTSV